MPFTFVFDRTAKAYRSCLFDVLVVRDDNRRKLGRFGLYRLVDQLGR